MNEGPTEAWPRVVEIDVEVRYAETDQMGVVHHANYIVWFELARTAWCLDGGLHYAEIERLGYLLMVTGAKARYLRPARYGDHVRIGCWLERSASRALRFGYKVRNGEELLTEGATDHIWISKETGRPCRLPVEVAETFRATQNARESPIARKSAEDPGDAQ